MLEKWDDVLNWLVNVIIIGDIDQFLLFDLYILQFYNEHWIDCFVILKDVSDENQFQRSNHYSQYYTILETMNHLEFLSF